MAKRGEQQMKRYLLFAGEAYEASGGWLDFVSDHDYPHEADAAARELFDSGGCQWFHVVDTDSGKIIQDEEGDE